MVLFVVARTRLDRYEELRREFEDWRDVRIVLDRREGDRRRGRIPMRVSIAAAVQTDAGLRSVLIRS